MLKIKVKSNLRSLSAKGTAIKRAARKVVRSTATTIRREANSEKPGFVRLGREDSETADTFTSDVWVVPTGTDMEAYEEFHTGAAAQEFLAGMPEDVRAVAWGYYKTGTGTLIGNPYFYPAVLRQRAVFVQNMEKALVEELSK